MRERPLRTATIAERIQFGAPERWDELQSWLAFEQPDERDRLAASLESPDERDFYAAAFELFLTQFLASRGWEFDRHPTLEWTARRPDYLVHHPDHGDFLLEAAVVMESDDVRAARRVRDALRDELDSVTGPFQGIMTLRGRLDGGQRMRDVSEWLRDQLRDLRIPDGESQEIFYPGDTFTIELQVMPDAESADQPVIVVENLTGGEAVDVTTHTAMRDSIDGKQARYGRPPMPFVVALDVQTDFPVERHSLIRSLYGTPQLNLRVAPGEPVRFLGETHQRNGMLTAVGQEGTPIRTRLSGVAVYKRTNARGEEPRHDLVLCHHPFAAFPLPVDAFAHIPQLMPSLVTDEEVVMRWSDDPAPPEWVQP